MDYVKIILVAKNDMGITEPVLKKRYIKGVLISSPRIQKTPKDLTYLSSYFTQSNISCKCISKFPKSTLRFILSSSVCKWNDFVQRSSNTALNCNILNWQRNFLTARWPRGHTFDLNSSTWLHACTKEDKRVANN